MKTVLWFCAVVAAMFIVNIGFSWYGTVLIGALLSVFRQYKGNLGLSFLAGAVSWVAPIFWSSPPSVVFHFAGMLGGAFGLGMMPGAIVALLLPGILGGGLSACGTWIGWSLNNMIRTQSSVNEVLKNV